MIIRLAIKDADLPLVCRAVLFVPVIVVMDAKEDALPTVEDALAVVQVVITVVQDALVLAAEDVKELVLMNVLNSVQIHVLRDVLAIVIMGVQVKKLIN